MLNNNGVNNRLKNVTCKQDLKTSKISSAYAEQGQIHEFSKEGAPALKKFLKSLMKLKKIQSVSKGPSPLDSPLGRQYYRSLNSSA